MQLCIKIYTFASVHCHAVIDINEYISIVIQDTVHIVQSAMQYIGCSFEVIQFIRTLFDFVLYICTMYTFLFTYVFFCITIS